MRIHTDRPRRSLCETKEPPISLGRLNDITLTFTKFNIKNYLGYQWETLYKIEPYNILRKTTGFS
jgi:hypothetical protein